MNQLQWIPTINPALNDLQIEHLARCAAEYGDTETEELCDECLDDPGISWVLLAVIDSSTTYQDWMLRGINRGYESR